MPRETVRRYMGRLVALGLFERAEDQTFVPTKQLREIEIERVLRLLRQERRDYCGLPSGDRESGCTEKLAATARLCLFRG